MILKHNIKPERVAEIAAVMRKSKQAFGVLSDGPGSFCAVGCIAEAYRLAHRETSGAWWDIDPDDGRVVFRSFPPGDCVHIHQSHADLGASEHVIEWAMGKSWVVYGRPYVFFGHRFEEGITFMALNDGLESHGKKPLTWFADVLEGKEVEL